MNTPNKLSLFRIILVPFVVFFYMASFVPVGKCIALILFIIATLTDFLDGYLARKNNQITTLGKLLDPVADKMLNTSALLLLVFDGTIPQPYGVIAAIILISRDIIVDALRQIAASKNVILAADKFGKLKTFLLDIAMVLLICYSFIINQLEFVASAINALGVVGWIYFGLGVIFSVISCINYLIKNRKVYLG